MWSELVDLSRTYADIEQLTDMDVGQLKVRCHEYAGRRAL
jgi:hypothetical protein